MAINPDTLRSERELHSFLLGVTDEQTRALTESWVRAWDSVSAELEAALSDLSAATTSGRVTRTQILRSARLQAALAATEDVLGTVARTTNDTIVADLWSVVSAGAEHEHEMIASQLGGVKRAELQAGLIRADPGQISAMVERSTAQITALTLPLAPQTYSAIKTELLRGIAVGANPRTAARRMVAGAEDKMNFGLSRALNIARTEMLDANRAAALAVDKANSKVLAGWIWMAHLDANTCRSCVAQHGELHDIEEPGPFDHQSGRCARVPKTKSWEELGFKGISDPPDSMPSADAFFDKLSDKQKRSMLGAKGYDAWKKGWYPRSAWSARRSTDGWRDSYVPSRPPTSKPVAAAPKPKPAPVGDPMPYTLKPDPASLQGRTTVEDYAQHRASLEELVRRLDTKKLQASPQVVTIDSKRVSKIVSDGRLKNVHEAQNTWLKQGKSEYLQARTWYETDIIGVPASAPAASKPIYGWVDDGTKAGLTDMYGNVDLVLKDSVRTRSTVTLGDSLNRKARPTPLSTVGDASLDDLFDAGLRQSANMLDFRDTVDSATERMSLAYKETQIYGGVSLDDIAEVRLRASVDDATAARVTKQFGKTGIPVRRMEE